MPDLRRNHTLCFTGHRWKGLPFGTNEKDPRCQTLVDVLTDEVIAKITMEGVTHFITGMALGTDTLAAEVVLRLKKAAFPQITLEAALFCPEQPGLWVDSQKQRFLEILSQCVQPPTITSPVYGTGCEHIRNRYMVDHSGYVIAVWDGRPSGTGKTVAYAKKKGVPIIRINPCQI